MKKIKILCAALLTIGLFTACKGPSGGDNNPGENPEVKPSNEEAKGLYQKLIGSKWTKMYHNGSFKYPEIVVFSENSVSFDSINYSFDQNNNLTNEESEAFFIDLGTETYEINFIGLDPLYTSPVGDLSASSHIYITNTKDPLFSENRLAGFYACISTNTHEDSTPVINKLPSGKYNITGNPDGYLEFSDNQLKFYYNNTLKNTYNISFESNKMSLSYSAAGYTFTSVFEFTESDDIFTFKKTDDTGLSLIAQWTHNYSMEEITLYK